MAPTTLEYFHVTFWSWGLLDKIICKEFEWSQLFLNTIYGTRGASHWAGRIVGRLQMNQLSLRNNRLKFKTSRELPVMLGESIEYTSNEWKQTRKMSTCTRLDLESVGSFLTMLKNFPGTRVPINYCHIYHNGGICLFLKNVHQVQCFFVS